MEEAGGRVTYEHVAQGSGRGCTGRSGAGGEALGCDTPPSGPAWVGGRGSTRSEAFQRPLDGLLRMSCHSAVTFQTLCHGSEFCPR